jgi:hypothetical protein
MDEQPDKAEPEDKAEDQKLNQNPEEQVNSDETQTVAQSDNSENTTGLDIAETIANVSVPVELEQPYNYDVPDSPKGLKRLADWLKYYKKSTALMSLLILAVVIGGAFLLIHKKTPTPAVASNTNRVLRSTISTKASTSKSIPKATTASTLPQTYNPSSGFSLATETYSPPAEVVSFSGAGSTVNTAAATLLTSRVLVYQHQTGIYTGISDAQIDLYDTSSQKNYVLVPGGTSSAAVSNGEPTLLANNKMLFVRSTGSGTNITSQLELIDLETGTISQVTVPFSDSNTFSAATVAPNGIDVAYPMSNAILILDTQTGATKSYPVSMAGSIFSGDTSYEHMAWSSDSSTIYYGSQYFITHAGAGGAASFQSNNIYALDVSTGNPTQITNTTNTGYDTLQVYGTRLYFKQFSTISASTEGYIDLSASASAATTIPNTSNFVWPILPTADSTEFAVDPGNGTTLNLMNFQGQLVQNIYANMTASGQLLKNQYTQSLIIGWANPYTLLIDLHGLKDDVYAYNIKTHAVSVIIKSTDVQQ